MAISKSNWNDDYLFKGNSSAEFIFNYGSQVTINAGDGRILYRAARVMIHSSAAPKTILFGVARAMIHSGAMMAKTYLQAWRRHGYYLRLHKRRHVKDSKG